MIKLFHIADCHLGVRFANKSSQIRKSLIDSVTKTFKSVKDFCLSNKIDILIIAGDLFDSPHNIAMYEKLFYDFALGLTKSGVKIVYCSGNHDPDGTLGSSDFFSALDGFYPLISADIVIHDFVIRNQPVQIIGNGYKTHNHKAVTTHKIQDYPKRTDAITIGVSHLSVENVKQVEKGEAPYNPTPLRDIQHLGYDYFALGHIHIREVLDEKTIAYSGSLHGLNINETGPHGGLVVELDNGKIPKITEINLAHTEFEKLELDITDIEDELRLQIEIERLCSQNIGQYNKYFRLFLIGHNNLSINDNSIDEIIQSLNLPPSIVCLELDISRLKYGLEIEELKSENSLISKMLREIDLIGEEEFSKIKKEYSISGDESLQEFKKFLVDQTILRLYGG